MTDTAILDGKGGDAGTADKGGVDKSGDAGADKGGKTADKGGKVDTSGADVGDKTDKGAGDDRFDWRKEIAGEDEKLYKELERTADLKQLHKRLTDTQKELRDQGRVKIPGKDSTDEERAAFAKSLGVPATPDKYDMKAIMKAALPQGAQATDSDKEFITAATTKLHAMGGAAATPAAIEAMAKVYFDARDDAEATLIANAQLAKERTDKELKDEWKTGYKAEMQYCSAGVTALAGPEGVDAVRTIKLQDGSLLGDNKDFLKLMNKAGHLAASDPLFHSVSSLGGSAKDWESRKGEIMAMRTGTYEQRKQYETLSAPGGELDTINAKLSAQKAA